MQTREQLYAKTVYEKVAERKNQYQQEDKNKYGSMAHKLPILIRSAGLCQSLEFINTRKDAQRDILADLAAVIGHTETSLLTRSREAQITEYMLLTEHALAALLWFKRYAQSVLEVTADMGNTGGVVP